MKSFKSVIISGFFLMLGAFFVGCGLDFTSRNLRCVTQTVTVPGIPNPFSGVELPFGRTVPLDLSSLRNHPQLRVYFDALANGQVPVQPVVLLGEITFTAGASISDFQFVRRMVVAVSRQPQSQAHWGETTLLVYSRDSNAAPSNTLTFTEGHGLQRVNIIPVILEGTVDLNLTGQGAPPTQEWSVDVELCLGTVAVLPRF